MLLNDVFEKFVQNSPVSVMVRGMLEHALPASLVDEVFEQHAEKQYKHQLLFSQIVDLLGSVVAKTHPSINAAYQRQQEEFSVSSRSVYNKVNKAEPRVLQALVRGAAQRMAPTIDELGTVATPLPGYRVKILDGNHLPASEHRLKELQTIAAGPLPGQALVVLDPQRGLVCDVYPCEDGHAQERSLIPEVVEHVEPDEVWVADRNFCTSLFLWEVDLRKAYFVVRQHAANVTCEATGTRRRVGRVEGGTVYEQPVRNSDGYGGWLNMRRITLKLDKPTTDGETDINLLSNLPASVKATKIANVYKTRWTIEKAFFDLATALKSELRTMGYPPAALFGFCVGLLAYNILSVVKSALRSVHGKDKIDQEVSSYYLADEIGQVSRGMLVAIPAEHWTAAFSNLTAKAMARLLKSLAKKVNLKHFKKHPRGPKKPAPKRVHYKRKPHVSTARILADRKA